MRSIATGACALSAAACGWASHSANERAAATTRPAAAATSSNSRARQPASAASTAPRSVCGPMGRPSRRSTPSRWCGKLACTRTQPSAARYKPDSLSHTFGVSPSTVNQARLSSTACSASTLTCCAGPPRARPIWTAASAAAPKLACAAVAMANDDGSTAARAGSSMSPSASGANPASRHRASSACAAGMATIASMTRLQAAVTGAVKRAGEPSCTRGWPAAWAGSPPLLEAHACSASQNDVQPLPRRRAHRLKARCGRRARSRGRGMK